MRSPRASSPSSRPASPRRASAGGAAFGSSSPRQLELWVGRFHETLQVRVRVRARANPNPYPNPNPNPNPNLQGGGTFNERAARAPGTYSDRPSSPGPGDYEASPSAFSRGAPGRDARGRREWPSAAFSSASVRLV